MPVSSFPYLTITIVVMSFCLNIIPLQLPSLLVPWRYWIAMSVKQTNQSLNQTMKVKPSVRLNGIWLIAEIGKVENYKRHLNAKMRTNITLNPHAKPIRGTKLRSNLYICQMKFTTTSTCNTLHCT